MDNETLFYIFGGIAAVSAVLVTFAGLKLKNFPGRMFPLVIVWFAAFAVAASTFSVLQAQDHEAHEQHEQHEEAEKLKEEGSGPFENEGGALGGEREELEEQAENEAEGSPEEESVGPTEGEDDKGEQGNSEPEGTGSGTGGTAGATVFAENCAGCHGETGLGGPGGPDLTSMPLAQTEEGTIEQVTNGGGGMPAFGDQLSEEEISDVAAFVVQDVVGK